MSTAPEDTRTYIYVWEFYVKADRQDEFERHYGADGTWVALFRQAAGFVETLLLKDRSVPLRYLTVDRWQTADAYRAFRQRFAREYAELDRQCEGLTERESPIGEFGG